MSTQKAFENRPHRLVDQTPLSTVNQLLGPSSHLTAHVFTPSVMRQPGVSHNYNLTSPDNLGNSAPEESVIARLKSLLRINLKNCCY